MRINVDRICELAGIPGAKRTRGGLMREGAEHGHSVDEMDDMYGEGSYDEGKEEAEEGMKYEMMDDMSEEDVEKEGAEHDDPMEEMLEIDEADLVKELRRMKVQMHEARKIERRRQENLQETQLKAIIDQEVKNVLKELNLNSGWMYGKRKPTRSRRGYTHQGSYLKGIGFK